MNDDLDNIAKLLYAGDYYIDLAHIRGFSMAQVVQSAKDYGCSPCLVAVSSLNEVRVATARGDFTFNITRVKSNTPQTVHYEPADRIKINDLASIFGYDYDYFRNHLSLNRSEVVSHMVSVFYPLLMEGPEMFAKKIHEDTNGLFNYAPAKNGLYFLWTRNPKNQEWMRVGIDVMFRCLRTPNERNSVSDADLMKDYPKHHGFQLVRHLKDKGLL